MRWGTPCCCYQQQSLWRKNNSSFVELGISRPLGRRGCQTIPVAPASLGTKWAADIFAEGNSAKQSKGSVGTSYGSGWIIEPNQEILLEIESLEAAQNISARLEMYNGLLDLPL